MRNFRMLFTLLTLFIVVGTTSAQSKGIAKKADKSVTELNEKLTAIDASLALSEEQISKAKEIFVAGMTEMKEAKKATTSKEEGKKVSKPIRKEMNKKIRKEVLSKEQKKALKANKKKD